MHDQHKNPKSDIEIAQEARMLPIAEVASGKLGIDLKDLLDEPWAMPEPDNVASTLIDDGFRSAGLKTPTPRVISDSTTVRTRLVEIGRFLTFLPGSTLHFGADRKSVV